MSYLLINSKRRTIKPTKVRPERRHMARYIGKAGTVEKKRRRSPKSKLGEKSHDQAFRKMLRSSSTIKKFPAASGQKVEPSAMPSSNLLGKCLRDESSPVASFGAAALQRSRRRVDRARGRSRGEGRGARPAKRAVEKAPARHNPGGNSSISLEISASLSVTVQAGNDVF